VHASIFRGLGEKRRYEDRPLCAAFFFDLAWGLKRRSSHNGRKNVNMSPNEIKFIAEMRVDLDKLKRKVLVDDFAEAQIKVNSGLYEKANTYTNLLMAGGYAGFFGIWALAKPYLDKTSALLAALLMSLSLTVFIGFEIYKTYLMTVQTRRLTLALFDGSAERSGEDFVANLKIFQAANTRDALRMSKYWPVGFFVGLAFTLAGAVVMLHALVVGLLTVQ